MNITLNGEPAQFSSELTAAQLIDSLGLGGKRLAVEVNLEIVPRSTYESFIIKENDNVEIVHAIGGG
ncbi:MAG: sulfur carrier protein ThiS [Gammaproteobacteria bacterium]|nr:sulfur carrier protein ThiS [Gammaproteobacteria bacterium]MDH5802620.1 sulfur carrier protein ThiS [Gammaproteobacteria bacterium]